MNTLNFDLKVLTSEIEKLEIEIAILELKQKMVTQSTHLLENNPDYEPLPNGYCECPKCYEIFLYEDDEEGNTETCSHCLWDLGAQKYVGCQVWN